MARVTVEDCLERIPNRFALTMLAAERARQLAQKRSKPFIKCDNKAAVTSLREIADGKIWFREDVRAEIDKYLEEMKLRGARLSVVRREHPIIRPTPVETTEE
ncbi:MAG: DNA-directed RNA polymerase subunit omega [Deltaproteobacteria bacterium]|nr:DNA-directed RNA polymerase subunit omega [Deltaproteobacteria bacterium]